VKKQGNKSIPVTGRGGLYGCEMLRIPHCLNNRLTDGGKVVSLNRRTPTTLQKHFLSLSGTQATLEYSVVCSTDVQEICNQQKLQILTLFLLYMVTL
jgi:hypothetical protein